VYIVFNGSATVVGGTSVGAPIWAGIVAIADQGRALSGQSTLDGRSQTLPALYSMSSANFHDITTGTTSNGSSTLNAGSGYDLVTGRGTPFADLVVAGLVSYSGGGSSGGGTGGGSTGGSTGTGGGGGGHKGKHSTSTKIDLGPVIHSNLDLLTAEASLFSSTSGNGLFTSLFSGSSSDQLGTIWDRPLSNNHAGHHA
jgi:subtilase family serine protease